MTSPITNFANTMINPTPPAAENIWTKEANPNIENDSFNNSSQNPAAANLNPGVGQYVQASANKMKTFIIAGITAVAAGLTIYYRKHIPVIKGWAEKIEQNLQKNKYFEKLKNFFKEGSVGKFFQNRQAVTNLEDLKKYADYVVKNPDAAVRRIKIHSKALETNQSMAEALENVRIIAEDFVTTSGNKGKKPVFHIILNPEHADEAAKIIEQLNTKGKLDIAEGVVQKVEMIMERSGRLSEKLAGEHSSYINVGPPRHIDRKELWLNTFWQWLTRPTPNQIPK